MSTSHPMPRPGRLLAWLMVRRLSRTQRELLLSELEELHQHRMIRDGADAARRWLTREYRRWTWRLVLGGVALTIDPSDVLAAGPEETTPSLIQDLRHSLRGLLRTPVFSASLALTVGLGIGGACLVFTVVHSVLIAPLPYDDGDRLVLMRTVRGPDMWGTSMADLDALYHEPPPAIEEIGGYTYQTPAVALGDAVELIRSKRVTASYFPMMGIDPIRGRHFTSEESLPGGEDAVMITERFAERAFPSGDPLGGSLSLDGRPHTVVAILPNELGPIDRVDIYPSLRVVTPGRKGPFFFPMVAKLQEGVTPELAQAQLDDVAASIFPLWLDSFPNDDATIGFVDLKEQIVGNTRRTLFMVLTAVGLLLLIAAANAASLLVARGMTREREVSIRSALGASRGRLVRLLMTEAALLGTAGAALGWVITMTGVDLVRRLGAGSLPRAQDIAVTAESATFFVVVAVSTWALFGLIATGTVLARRTGGLASTWSRATASRRAQVVRRGLVAAQFAITIPLLVGAGLLGRSLDRLQNEDLGFDPENLISMMVSLPPASYDWASALSFWDVALPRIEALPGVEEAGLANARPPVINNGPNNFVLEDRPPAPDENLQAPWITADAGYFEVLGLDFVEGIPYRPAGADTMRTAVVDQGWQERFYPGESAIGRRFRSGGCTIEGCPWVEVVGVVSNVKTVGLHDDFGTGTIYYNYRHDSYLTTNLHLRTVGDPHDYVLAAQQAISEIDPTVAFADVRTVDEVADQSVTGRRYTSLLVSLLASVALLLSMVGIYGAMAYFVRQHTREIGVRIALGGSPASALRMVVERGLTIALLGTIVGTGGALFLTRFMRSLLYGVSSTDPVVFTAVILGSLLLACVASAIPGRAAAGTDAAVTLREE